MIATEYPFADVAWSKKWTSAQVRAWRGRHNWSQSLAAEMIGYSLSGYKLLEKNGAGLTATQAMKYIESQRALGMLKELLHS